MSHALTQAEADQLQQELNGLGAQLATRRAQLVMQHRAYQQAKEQCERDEDQIVTLMTSVSAKIQAMQALAQKMPPPVADAAPVAEQPDTIQKMRDTIATLERPHPAIDAPVADAPAEPKVPAMEST